MAWVAPNTEGFRSKKGVGCVSVGAAKRVLCLGPVHKQAKDIKGFFERLEFTRIPTGYEKEMAADDSQSRRSKKATTGRTTSAESFSPSRMGSVEDVEFELEGSDEPPVLESPSPKRSSCFCSVVLACIAAAATGGMVYGAACLLGDASSLSIPLPPSLASSLRAQINVVGSMVTTHKKTAASAPDTTAPVGRSSLPAAPASATQMQMPWKSAPCKRGTFATAEGKCRVCPAGTFTASEGSEYCTSCPMAYTSEEGSSECKLSQGYAIAGTGFTGAAAYLGKTFLWKRG